MVLVANNDMYPDIAITPADVRVRELTTAEKSGGYYELNKGKLLPANVGAANLRIPNRLILADEALRRDMFRAEIGEAVILRLAPGMSAVNVLVPRERAGGGVIQLGDSVNVNLAMRITKANGKQTIRMAEIARDCRVIMKRNSLYPKLKTDPEGNIAFTLEANPYRAALIDFAEHKGEISLVPVPAKVGKTGEPRVNSNEASEEYRDDDTRIRNYLKGNLQITNQDLERIFKIQSPPPKPDRPWPELSPLRRDWLFVPEPSLPIPRLTVERINPLRSN